MAKIKVIKSGKETAKAPELLPVGHRIGRSGAAEVSPLNVWHAGAEKLFDCQEYDSGFGGGSMELCSAHRRVVAPRGSRELPMSVRFLGLYLCPAFSACSRTPVASARSSNEPITLAVGLPLISGQDSLNGIQQIVRLLSLEGLNVIGRDGRPQPRLAEGWTESPDGLSWTIRLRQNAVFHDGTPVDAPAVKASLGRTLSSPARDFSPGLLDIIAIETPRSDQVIVRLKARSAFLLDDLAVPISKRRSGTGGSAQAPI